MDVDSTDGVGIDDNTLEGDAPRSCRVCADVEEEAGGDAGSSSKPDGLMSLLTCSVGRRRRLSERTTLSNVDVRCSLLFGLRLVV